MSTGAPQAARSGADSFVFGQVNHCHVNNVAGSGTGLPFRPQQFVEPGSNQPIHAMLQARRRTFRITVPLGLKIADSSLRWSVSLRYR